MIHTLSLTISGQCPSGKNAMLINPRTGHHYPGKRFAAWREGALWELKPQTKGLDWLPIDEPVTVFIRYWAKDKRRRDAPGIIDALWHLLEKAEVVTDDTYLGGLGASLRYEFMEIDRKNPRVRIDIVK